MGTLDPESSQAFWNWLQLNMKTCRICDGSKWALPMMVALPAVVDGKMALGAAPLTAIAVACLKCAHMEFFSTKALEG